MEQHPNEQTKTCPACQHNGFDPLLMARDHTVSQLDFVLADCHHCGLRATTPRPTPAAIGNYYLSDNYISHTNSNKSLFDKAYQLARTVALGTKRRTIAKYAPDKGTLLDFGCGTGEFAAHMKEHGHQVAGVEPSASAREQARRHLGDQVYGSLEGIPDTQRYSVVTLWHVLEHLHDPRLALEQIHKRVQEGGHLVIAVPDRDSWDAKHYADLWAAYDVPRHLFHFRRTDVHQLLNNAGFQLEDTRKMWMDAPYVSILSERHKGRSPARALVQGGLLGLWSNLVSASTSRPTSSTLFIARKRPVH